MAKLTDYQKGQLSLGMELIREGQKMGWQDAIMFVRINCENKEMAQKLKKEMERIYER